MHTYANRVQSLMDRDGIDRTRLAEALGISYQAVKKLLDEDGKFGRANNLKAAALFKVSSDWLSSGVEDAATEAAKLSRGANDLAKLFDLIPESDLVRRAQAYAGASGAIVQVLQDATISLQESGHKKQSA